MLKTASVINQTDNFVFVLWGEHFEEAVAAIFATRLRQVGLCVKIVGLAGQRPIGKNGLALYPDITLGEAVTLANQAICVVLPCSVAILRHAEADPRIIDFFQKSHVSGAKFVASDRNSIRNTRLEKVLIRDETLLTYGTLNNIMVFVDELASSLSNAYGV